MFDNLEQHIRDNREALDTLSPDVDRLWDGIEVQLPAVATVKRPIWQKPLVRWAASLLLAIGVGIGWGEFQETATVIITEGEATQSGLPAEFANMEAYYREAIEQHRTELVAYHDEGIQLDDRFSVDLGQLHQDYKSLQDELNLSENPETVIDAMVQNLSMQLDIVQQQLRILETIKKAKQTTNDAVQI